MSFSDATREQKLPQPTGSSALNSGTAIQSVAGSKPVLDTMIELAHARQSHRVIVAGSAALDIHAALCRRGFCRVVTATHYRTSCTGGRDVGLIVGYQSLVGLEAALLRVAPLLNSDATIAIWVNAVGSGHGQTVQRLLEAKGFGVQSGAKCENGFVLAARHREGITHIG